ncbi:MAG TPA: dolichyl-phosphate beta-glucosyltransferase [Herpetosiphonaceae bacterium]|nr:dolichyl-phosphate beta-glucosyltransferase [Herpetosiphonaceae bacterium]
MELTLSVVIPAYNEERRLPRTITTIASYLEAQPYACEMIVVDDGSTDQTAARAEELGQTSADVPFRVIRNKHRGKGYTVRTGMLEARGRYVLFTDADLATPIEEWDKLYVFLRDGDDVVIGSREGLGAQRIGEPWHRHFMGRIFNGLVRTVALGGIQDTQCGFKAFTQPAARRIFSALQLYGDDARQVRGAAVTAFDVEVLYLARKWGYSIREVPVIWRYGEETKVDPLRDSWRNFTDVLRVRWNAMRSRYDERSLPSSQ